MLAVAIEKSGVHKRMAYLLLKLVGGTSAKRIMLAVMVSAATLSMWISNTATVVALLPVVIAITLQANNPRFTLVLLLGLAYSASIGGMGTIIGTPPNLIFAAQFSEVTGGDYGFISWLKVGVPIVIASVLIAWLWLSRGLALKSHIPLPELGKWQSAEVKVLAIFSVVALLWVFRTEPLGGYSQLLGLSQIGDSTIALLGVLAMALVKDAEQKPLLSWDDAAKIPWQMLLLFAGGICLAKGFASSGLSTLIGEQLQVVGEMPKFVSLVTLTASVSFLTEFVSNTASATLLMPIMANLAEVLDMPVASLMIPVVISTSCAFCLPAATAPNAMVFASGKVTVKDMVKEGALLNLLLAIVIASICYLIL